jgi:hypothetical protein
MPRGQQHALGVFLHTDTPFRPPQRSSFHAVTAGWWMGNVSRYAREFDCCFRAPWSLHAVHKYDWLLSQRRQAPNRAGVLLADSDIMFQCDEHELLQRFRLLQSPLVVSGERKWYPLPRDARDPFGPPARWPWKRRYVARHNYQFYPNSGLLMGTWRGFEAMVVGMRRANPRFPCCSFEGEKGGFVLDPCTSCKPQRTFPHPVSCVVEDQACLQTALASQQHAPRHVVDSNASLFLNLGELGPADVEITAGGRLAFKPTGQTPCVLHANGYKGVLHLIWPMLNQSAVHWMPLARPTSSQVRGAVGGPWGNRWASVSVQPGHPLGVRALRIDTPPHQGKARAWAKRKRARV